jgi:hypothetical protein
MPSCSNICDRYCCCCCCCCCWERSGMQSYHHHHSQKPKKKYIHICVYMYILYMYIMYYIIYVLYYICIIIYMYMYYIIYVLYTCSKEQTCVKQNDLLLFFFMSFTLVMMTHCTSDVVPIHPLNRVH